MRKLLLFLLFISFFSVSPKPANAVYQYQPFIINPNNLVIATLENEEVNCEREEITYHFLTDWLIKGKVEKNFKIVNKPTFMADKCPNWNVDEAGNIKIRIPFPYCDSPTPFPKFETGKTYIMTLELMKNKEYYPSCLYRIVDEAKGVLDPKVFGHIFIFFIQPLITFILMFPFMVSRLTNFFK